MLRAMMGVGLLVLAAGCGDKDTTDGDTGATDGSEDALAAEVWDEIDGYTGWGQLTGYEGITAATSVHTEFVQIWLNSTALADAEAGSVLSDGAIVVKETYEDESGSTIKDISILKKIDGYSADSNDLFWAQYETDGSINVAGTPDGCVGCHDAEDSDGDGLTFNE